MKNEICVPVGALAVGGGDGGESTPPGVGDTVEFKGTGTVARVEGGNAYLTPSTVNGEPVMDGMDHEPDADDMEGMVRAAREQEAMP